MKMTKLTKSNQPVYTESQIHEHFSFQEPGVKQSNEPVLIQIIVSLLNRM